ncbi:Flagellar biosynthesis protein FliQ [uncultured Alphaproteobacteria bacterium]|uniref:Flagellar biosynthetic protein FliQ n=1 Tax=uncultured Alphaproteobacteria bacterium TaxID=91750 RepID=A0A212JNQ2_9PROT|nr:Flagellar biosynthesis protein FliQ [uncultured Alphaproteobacteria bacterium]
MNEAQVLEVAREAVWTLVLVSAPVLLVGMAIGLAISLFQTLTQIQEMTLTFVPKLLIVFGSLILLLPFMFHEIRVFAEHMFDLVIAPR